MVQLVVSAVIISNTAAFVTLGWPETELHKAVSDGEPVEDNYLPRSIDIGDMETLNPLNTVLRS